MSIGATDEAPRPADGQGFSEAVTVAFGDPRADLFGVARVGLAEGGASGLTVLFWRGEPVSVRAEGGVEVDAPASWDEVSAAGLARRSSNPCAWRLHYAGDGARSISSWATGPLAELDPGPRSPAPAA